MKNKNGFTLIELLAVIVILAIIALIAMPIILNIIEKARKNAFMDMAYGLMDAAKLQYTEETLDHTQTSKSYTFPQTGTDILKFSGSEPDGGTLNIDEQGNIELAIYQGKWCLIKDIYDSEISIQRYDKATCKIAIPTPEKCFTFDASTGTITDYLRNPTDCLGNVVIPKVIGGTMVKAIGNRAFAYDQLKTVVIPNSVTIIGDGAFYKNQLTSVAIGNSVTSIGKESFFDNMLKSVEIPSSVTSIGENAFLSNLLTNVIIPGSVTSIGNSAFNNNRLPDDQAFIYARNGDGTTNTTKVVSYGGARRSNVIIPSSVTSIGAHAFELNQLTSVVIPSSVTSIGERAFSSNRLTNVLVPNSVTSIGNNAFAWNDLTSVMMENGLISIGEYAFSNNDLTSVTIPLSVTNIGRCAFNNNQLPDDQAFIYARNSDGSIDYTKLVSYGGSKKGNVVIPDGVMSIGRYAFASNQLTSVEIPNSVTSIGERAFSGNQLTSVVIGNSVMTIEKSAFESNQLTNLTIPSSVMSIGDDAFINNQFTSVTIQGKSSKTDFTSYPNFSPFGWATGYTDSNIVWNG